MNRSLLVSLLLATAVAPPALRAQGVLVAPHAVIIDHRTRSGSITLTLARTSVSSGTHRVQVLGGQVF